MKEYQVIEGNDWSFTNLIRRVNEACEEGWEPQGGLAIAMGRTGLPRYFQAMVRKTTHPTIVVTHENTPTEVLGA
jgi:hypothetical protein